MAGVSSLLSHRWRQRWRTGYRSPSNSFTSPPCRWKGRLNSTASPHRPPKKTNKQTEEESERDREKVHVNRHRNNTKTQQQQQF